ncbi:acyltransferase family protein [Phycicoccus flavus]|uniref:Acyltransferase n=1 Tax=Phycicoccus flavus TaxID=2502783 RepID=A0A8T6R690_9MICO|nr:acyltransferase [Phycicoccus flavus]NHA69154.1 acyltransferase [Phycicoccus flavus]
MREDRSAGRTRNAAMDGLRGFAALAVVSAHMAIHLGLLPYPPLGIMGVIVFFVLSGYLIAGICWDLEPTMSAWRIFVRRRIVRLAPALFGLVVVGGSLLIAFGQHPVREVVRGGLMAVTQTTAFFYAADVPPSVAFLPTWSLTVEWTFYLLFPLALVTLRRRGVDPERAVPLFAGTAVALYGAGLALPFAGFYLLPVANLGVLLAGATLSTWHRTHREPWAVDPARTSMALVLLGIFVLLPGYPLSWGWKLSVLPGATIATLVVLHGCWAGNSAARKLAARPLRAVGRRAYSLYLWHLPVLWLVWVNSRGVSPWIQAGLVVAGTAMATMLSFVFLERPVLAHRPGVRASAFPRLVLVRPRWTTHSQASSAEGPAVAPDAA